MSEIERFVLRVPTEMMGRMRALAQAQHRSINGEYLQAVQAYLRNAGPAERTGTMRWVMDNREYNTETAEQIAHGGTRSRYEEPGYVLYRTPGGDYFALDELEDGGREISVLNAREALEVYLGMPVHVLSEDEAFAGT